VSFEEDVSDVVHTVDTPDIIVRAGLDRRSEHKNQTPERNRVLLSGMVAQTGPFGRGTPDRPGQTYLSGKYIGERTSHEGSDKGTEFENSREQSEGLGASEVGIVFVQLQVSVVQMDNSAGAHGVLTTSL